MKSTAHIESFEVSFKVAPHNSGLRLDEFMKAMLPRYSRNELHNIIDTRLVWKERRIKKGTRVRTGDDFFFLSDKKAECLKDEDIPVLFEDEHILIVNKPPGSRSMPPIPGGKTI